MPPKRGQLRLFECICEQHHSANRAPTFLHILKRVCVEKTMASIHSSSRSMSSSSSPVKYTSSRSLWEVKGQCLSLSVNRHVDMFGQGKESRLALPKVHFNMG